MKLNKDLNPTKIQQMSKKSNKNPTNEPKTQQESNNSSEKPNKFPTKKPNIEGRLVCVWSISIIIVGKILNYNYERMIKRA